MTNQEIEREAEAYLRLSPLPSIERYARARVVELRLSPSDAVSYALNLRREANRLTNEGADPESKRSQKALSRA